MNREQGGAWQGYDPGHDGEGEPSGKGQGCRVQPMTSGSTMAPDAIL